MVLPSPAGILREIIVEAGASRRVGTITALHQPDTGLKSADDVSSLAEIVTEL